MNLQIDQEQTLTAKKSHFSIPEEVSYLNCAYMSPLSNEVVAAGRKGLVQKARPYQITSKDFFEPVEQLKVEFAKLIGAKNHQRVVVVPSASYGFATVAKNLEIKPGENLVVLEQQFPSNAYIWQRLCREQSLELRVISPPETNRDGAWSEKILEAIDEKTALVSIGILHWADGTVFDIQAIRARTNSVGARFILDGTQAIGAFPFNIDTVQPDALICAGYKWLMGPYSIGLAYFGPEFDEGLPLEENWINRIKSDDFQAQVGYQQEYRPFSTRFDMGEKSNFILVPMLQTAIAQVREWGVERIQHYCRTICADELARLQSLGFEMAETPYRAGHLFGLRPPAGFNFKVVDHVLKENKVYISYRGSVIRVSPHVYNTSQDLEKLSDCLIEGLP